ncbi:hypothetical protein D3C72_2417100 [compost metagenome]
MRLCHKTRYLNDAQARQSRGKMGITFINANLVAVLDIDGFALIDKLQRLNAIVQCVAIVRQRVSLLQIARVLRSAVAG